MCTRSQCKHAAVLTVRDKQPASYELSSDSDDDAQNTVVIAVSSPAPRLEQLHDAMQVPRRYSADDRPITPMRNQMLYSMMLESDEFVDGMYCTDLYAITGSLFSGCLCVRVCDRILKVCEHSILQTTCANFTKFTT